MPREIKKIMNANNEYKVIQKKVAGAVFTDVMDWTEKSFTNLNVKSGDRIAITQTSTTPAWEWTIVSTDGGFTITSTVAEDEVWFTYMISQTISNNATDINYNNVLSHLTADNVQAAIDELSSKESNSIYYVTQTEYDALPTIDKEDPNKNYVVYTEDVTPKTGIIRISPISPLEVKYFWYGTQNQYDILVDKYTVEENDTAFFIV